MIPHNLLRSAVAAFALTGILFASTALASESEEAAVKAANAQFYSALNVFFQGDVEPMKQLWSHKPDITYMGPAGGVLVGWDQVLPSWESQAALKLGGEVKPEGIHIFVSGDLAVVQNIEAGKNTNADGKTVEVSIRATNVFRKEDGAWKMISHHTDLLPFLAK